MIKICRDFPQQKQAARAFLSVSRTGRTELSPEAARVFALGGGGGGVFWRGFDGVAVVVFQAEALSDA